jgi:hypothetical protein
MRKQIFRHTALLLSLLGSPMLAWAGPLTSLPEGQVACLTYKQAKQYAQSVQAAPAFAVDLLARASCYRLPQGAQGLQVSKEPGFASYKLLSGHTIWLAR